MEGKAEPPTEPRVNTEIGRPTRAAELEPKHVLVAIQCRPVCQEHATGCSSMQDHPPVGLHPAAQVRHVHSVEKRRPPQQQQLAPPATRRDTTGGACHTSAGVLAVGVPCCRLIVPWVPAGLFIFCNMIDNRYRYVKRYTRKAFTIHRRYSQKKNPSIFQICAGSLIV